MAVVTSDTLLSAVVYIAGETIDIQNGATVTMDATPAIRPGTIQCLTRGRFLMSNASTTTPIVLTINGASNDFIFEQNGIFEGRGAAISLGAATGAASETFSFASPPLDTIPYPTHVEIETSAGSGVYVLYFVVTTAGTAVVFATTEFCAINEAGRVLFWDATTRVLTAGDGTNGSLLPAGANVRIPNIYVTSAGTSTTPASRTLIDLNPSGTIDMEWVAFSDRIYMNTSTIKKFRWIHTGICGEFAIANSNVSEFTTDHVSVQPDNQQTATTQQCRISSINGPVYLNKLVALVAGLVTSTTVNQITNCFGMTAFDDCTFARRNGRNDGSDRGFYLQNINRDFQVNNLSTIGGRLELVNLSSVTFVNIGHADTTSTTGTSGTLATAALVCVNISNCKFLAIGNSGATGTRNELVNLDNQSKDNEFYNANYNAFGNTAQLYVGSDITCKFVNCIMQNLRGDIAFINSNASLLNTGGVFRNCRTAIVSGTFLGNDPVQLGEINFVAGDAANVDTAFPAGFGYTFANLVEKSLTPATGALVAGPFGETVSASISGGAFYNQTGAIALQEINSSIVTETTFSCFGITSFVNADPVWTYTEASVANVNITTAPTNVTAEFRVRTPSGVYGAYQALTGANLSGAIAALTGYDSDVGLYFQLRLTSTNVDATRIINKVYFATNVDSGYAAPDGALTLLGPEATDVTTMYRASDNTVIATFTGSGAKTFIGSATYFGENIYYIRRTSGAVIIASSQSAPVAMKIGEQGNVSLFCGNEVQLAQAPDIAAIPAGVWSLTSESSQSYGKQFRDIRATLLGTTTGGGTTVETFLAADESTPRVVSTNDGKDRIDVTVSGA